jgi:hypothetical protein
MPALPTVSFDVAHHEIFNLSTGLKVLRRKLSANFKLTMNKDPITLERLRDAAIFVITGPREKFTTQEFDAMTEYLKEGGSILVTLGEGGEAKFGTNINYLLEEYGIACNTDAVLRTVYRKSGGNKAPSTYLHPKEVHVINGVLNQKINTAAGKRPAQHGAAGGAAGSVSAIFDSSPQASLRFAYAYGASLSVQKPAFPVLSSGHIAYPLNRCARPAACLGGCTPVVGGCTRSRLRAHSHSHPVLARARARALPSPVLPSRPHPLRPRRHAGLYVHCGRAAAGRQVGGSPCSDRRTCITTTGSSARRTASSSTSFSAGSPARRRLRWTRSTPKTRTSPSTTSCRTPKRWQSACAAACRRATT